MHKLDPETAFLYWIPTISIFLIMTIFLGASFWRYRRKKERSRQSQRDYLDLAFSIKRPRIGALSCHTHGNQWTELMQSFSTSQIKSIMREFQMDQPHQFETVAEESKSHSLGSETDPYRSPAEYDQVLPEPVINRGGTRQGKSTFKDAKPAQYQSINVSSLQFKDCEQTVKDKVEIGNLYYEDNYSVPFDKKKKIEKKLKKNKRKRRFLSFATRRDENDDDILDELQIASNKFRTPASLSPVCCDTKQLTKNSPFTVEIASISEDTPEKEIDFSQGAYPSYPIGTLDSEQPSNKHYNDIRKSHEKRDTYDFQPKKVKTTELEDRQNDSTEKSTERLVWVTADDVSQTPV
ncbi:uncharacterized protein LOC133173856 [Saccostrea echinata]|uniref:uncharacterized protein LOC133173856 n=1 Tax=Saccostrea echinata TaxID=191078 RepID=UPI002A804956|nr:uncharacterized protein LOC133173856 [Saccostrea echinata]